MACLPKRLISIVLLCVGGAVGYCLPHSSPSSVLSTNILISAAHVTEIPGYSKIYTDSSRDVAYYMSDHKNLTVLKPQPVKIDGLSNCRIVSSTEGAFVVETDSIGEIYDGLSGFRVYSSSDEILGFVVGLKSAGQLECRTNE